MGWKEQIVFSQCESVDESGNLDHMKPGLTGIYDRELREKAGISGAPVPPAYMGLQGEYDPHGLAKRVAKALDRHAQLTDINTLTFAQKGNVIVFNGQVSDLKVLDSITDVTSRVDGTHGIDVDHVTVTNTSL